MNRRFGFVLGISGLVGLALPPLRAVTRWSYGAVSSIAGSPDGRRQLFVRTTG